MNKVMTVYKQIIFFETYNLEDDIPKLYNDLVEQFNNFVGHLNFFQENGFTLLIGSNDEVVKKNNNDYYLLDVIIVFPSSISYKCTICWKLIDDKINFYWTNKFPLEQLKKFLNQKIKSEEGYL